MHATSDGSDSPPLTSEQVEDQRRRTGPPVRPVLPASGWFAGRPGDG